MDPQAAFTMFRPSARFLALGLALVCICVTPRSEAQLPDAQPASESATSNQITTATGLHPRTMTYMKRQWGVEVMFVRQASAGYMLEFRYKVLDPEKAAPLFNRQTKPLLIHAETGAELIVPTPPTTGALRNSNPPLVDHTYWMFFANPGKLIKPGDHVTVEIGDFRAENLVVR
jgi:hypothetical protein